MATYYVDPSGPNGSGTESSPFNALPANFSSAGYVNGDVFLFKRGTTYTPSWGNTPSTPGDAFTVNRQIRFGAYGTGAMPIISANYTGSAGGRLFRFFTSDCVFEDLHFANTNNCHIIYGSGVANLTVRRCKATQIRGTAAGNEGFVVVGSSTALTGTVTVTDNEIDGIANDGISIVCTGTVIIARNTVKNTSLDTTTGDCVAANGNIALLHIYDNNLDHTNKDTKQCIIQDGGSTGFAIIERNICNGYFVDGSVDHTGIYLSLPGVIRNNFIQTWRSGVFINVANARVEGNVIIQGGGTALTGAVWGSFDGMVVQNNVIWRIAGTDVADAAIRNNTSNAANLYRNNIIVGFNTGIRRGALAVDSYNDFYQVTTAVRDASNVAISAGTGTVYADPQLNSDGSIRSSSPVATAGTYVSGVTLANGRLRPNFVPIGAYMAVLPRTARV
jgi:hypothetical protein